MTTMMVLFSTTWSRVSTMSIKRFFLNIINPHLDIKLLSHDYLKLFLSYRKNTRMNQKSEIIIIDTACDYLSNELYEISIKKFLLFIMNY